MTKIDDRYFKFTGKTTVIENGETVEVMDPGYDDDVPFVVTVDDMTPGVYELFVSKNRTRTRVMASMLIHNEYKDDDLEYNMIPNAISVDAGLAGYFVDKPNFNDEEWRSFIDEFITDYARDQVYTCPWGMFTNTGYGDGVYDVCIIKERKHGRIVGVAIFFMDQEDYE